MLPSSSVGRKLVMAVTGQIMVLFVIGHLAGNLTIYFDKLNAYAAGLHALPILVWAARLALIVVVCLHIFYAVQLKLENNAARPVSYRKKKELESTFAGRNMVWSGAIIGTFLVYHLMHFTFQTIDPASAARANLDAAGRPDVFLMVARGLQRSRIALVYLFCIAAVWLHLLHGIQSSFQTLGLNGERSFPYIRKGGSIAAFLLFIAYASIPVALGIGLVLR